MGRIGMNEIDNYGSSTMGGYFQLKNDKDVAQVRFMYNDYEDIPAYAVHEVEVNGKTRYVSCLREYNEPVENCPLCEAKYKVLVKMFLQLYDLDSEEIKLWERGKSFRSVLQSLCARYKPLVSTPFEIERNGKPGDTGTTYMPYALATDDITLDDLPEVQELLGRFILQKSYEEMIEFLETGEFPSEEEAAEAPAKGRPATAPVRERQSAAPARRTPATGGAPQRTANAPAPGRRTSPKDRF